MPTFYQGKELTRYKEKSGGKNKSEVDGFYENSDHERFFIKKPADKSELFTELFAGLLLNEFKNRKLISEVYFPSLICADVIQFDDGSYGLIQPLVAFDELHKIIGTSYTDGSDRDPLKEALAGPNYYTSVTKLGESFGLSIALMFSLLLGAHSVHSGNIVALKGDEKSTSLQFGRIDWGDAFRNFAHKENNTDILYAYENRGVFNYKRFTKDYFLNFKKINGLFPAMAEKAKELLPKVPKDILLDMVVSALKKIPSDFINQTAKDKLASDMYMPSFKEVQLGSEAHIDTFATEMANLLEQRMTKITELKDIVVQEIPENMYASVIHIPPYTLTFKETTSFPDIIKQWSSSIRPGVTIDISGLNLANLAKVFNGHVSDLANSCESTNQWAHTLSNNYNIFQPYDMGQGEQIHGHAFVPQYKESTILRRLFSMDPHTLSTPRFAAFEKAIQNYSKEHTESEWVKIQTMLGLGQELIMLLNIINQTRKFGMEEEVSQNIERFKTNLAAFLIAEAEVRHLFENPGVSPQKEPNHESTFFYPVEDIELNQMTGDQLATIYLEEMNEVVPSQLIVRIIKNDTLWHRMNQAFDSGVYNPRLDSPKEKIAKAREWRQLFEIEHAHTAQHIRVLEQQTVLLNKEVKEKSEEAKNLNSDLQQQKEATQGLLKKVEQLEQQQSEFHAIKKEIARLKPEIELLQHQLDKAAKTELSVLREHSEEISSLNQKISEKESRITQLEEQLQTLQKVNTELQAEVKKEQQGKIHAEQSAELVKKELDKLSPELSRLQHELTTATQQGSLLSSEQVQKIEALGSQLKTNQVLLKQAHEELKQLDELNKTLHSELSQLKEGKTMAEHSAQKLTEELKTLKIQMEQLHLQLSEKDRSISELQQQRTVTSPVDKPLVAADLPSTESVRSKEQDELIQQQLKKEIALLQEELKKRKAQTNPLDELIQLNSIAQQKYKTALEHNKPINFARLERMAPVLLQVNNIEMKAAKLAKRNETEAAAAALNLASQIRTEIKEYAESDEQNEQLALNNFKIKAGRHIDASKNTLIQHREEWKYILANITVGILLLGIGYAAAILINKQVTGHYTFFSKTDSIKQVEQLNESIVSNDIKPLSGG
ncbi:LepB GTPase-activating domain-containing protein [Legionella bononiensis]|uniref:LepB GTPase-activating domain-containing protein n=1 Tax=Legionella bononiensis TaxID=2793102 RepID=A0ABS1W788_9GAMM|nr:LepB GTPase-activating domain-containing protein [Legionella bononiensis]MBL7481329.1 LepB GTPase-activating domain-containing protein [Legionella bononiensis]MBL7525233.1 LepB GTPase-activating domain-containing protein [Legionella bononiensis]MBL7561417.1 LepB GTPase-activating domain-containing protein [Legionella bononiensis]